MRAVPIAALALALAATGAAAQVQQNDPNAANASLARQGEIRALNQQRVSDFNLLNMQAQRNLQYRTYDPVIGGRGYYRGVRHGVPGRAVRGGTNTSVCIGC